MISESQVENFVDNFDMYQPVKGAWIRKERHLLVIGATTRSAIALFLVPFMFIITISLIQAFIMLDEIDFVAIFLLFFPLLVRPYFWAML
jgi:hypothetical protein